MTRTVNAVFEKGVFRPTDPVPLADGSRVELTVRSEDSPTDPAQVVAELARLARLPVEGPVEPFSGADHDSVLYGENGAR